MFTTGRVVGPEGGPETVNETDEGRSTIETEGKDYFILIRDTANDEVLSLRFPDDKLFAAACEGLDIQVIHEL
jgi:hypothetical protein